MQELDNTIRILTPWYQHQ